MGSKLKSMLYRSKWLLVAGLGLALGLLGVMNVTGLYTPTIKPTKYSEFAKTAVMITRLDGRSGGTGVILESRRNESKVLTNKHVCEVVRNGGIVRTDAKSAFVKYYQESEIHDMCVITVATNFKVNTVVADESPEPYDISVVSGHPSLYPTVINNGHFSEKQFVSILVGFKKCTEEDWKDSNKGMLCFFLGGLPIIRTYEAQLTSNMIMPGSSGSAVFNERGEISGLVFAGREGLSYALIVPHEYVAAFLKYELPELKKIQPNSTGSIDAEADKIGKNINWETVCKSNHTEIQKVCELVNDDMLLKL